MKINTYNLFQIWILLVLISCISCNKDNGTSISETIKANPSNISVGQNSQFLPEYIIASDFANVNLNHSFPLNSADVDYYRNVEQLVKSEITSLVAEYANSLIQEGSILDENTIDEIILEVTSISKDISDFEFDLVYKENKVIARFEDVSIRSHRSFAECVMFDNSNIDIYGVLSKEINFKIKLTMLVSKIELYNSLATSSFHTKSDFMTWIAEDNLPRNLIVLEHYDDLQLLYILENGNKSNEL